jgi:hypothetical protein
MNVAIFTTRLRFLERSTNEDSRKIGFVFFVKVATNFWSLDRSLDLKEFKNQLKIPNSRWAIFSPHAGHPWAARPARPWPGPVAPSSFDLRRDHARAPPDCGSGPAARGCWRRGAVPAAPGARRRRWGPFCKEGGAHLRWLAVEVPSTAAKDGEWRHFGGGAELATCMDGPGEV